MNAYMVGGITDISPVINSYTDALLDAFPQVNKEDLIIFILYAVLLQSSPNFGRANM